MPRPVESEEWCLLQTLGSLLERRKAQYQPRFASSGIQPDIEFLEFEFRRAFVIKESSQILSVSNFEHFRGAVADLCTFLDDVVAPVVFQASGQQLYPRFNGLATFLEGSSDTFDLISGRDPLFKLSDSPEQKKKDLASLSKCNDAISRLLSSQSEPVLQRPTREKSKRPWKDAGKRKRTVSALDGLFRHFRCGAQHELMMKFSDDWEDLHLLLSSCPDSETWQDVTCCSSRSIDTTGPMISDICAELNRYPGQDMNLSLLVEKYGVFGAWAALNSEAESSSHKESLEDLINKRAFEPALRYDAFKSQAIRFTPIEMRKLAVQLGYCLMDFFDADLSARRFYFLRPTGKEVHKDCLYVLFNSCLPAAEDLRAFGIGHPTLLSFAKLLLEIYSGASVMIDEISPQYDENNQNIWLKLCVYLEMLEKEHLDDSYLKAIRGCLNVHQKINRSLSSSEDKEQDVIIRKALYKEVVQKLEVALEKATPRPRHKRQRSDSPPPLSGRRPLLASMSSMVTSYPAELPPKGQVIDEGFGRRILPISSRPAREEMKRQRTECTSIEMLTHRPKLEPPFVTVLPVLEMATSGLFDDNTPTDFPTNLCAYADHFLGTKRSIYEATITEEPDDSANIKVAILDTGLDLGHPDIQANGERIKEIRSWLYTPDGVKLTKPNDPCGHGTHVTGLLLDVAPDCDVYVAQIADSRESRPLSAHRIVRAITHAVNVWKVDIISMSFGFPDESEDGCHELRDAILFAHSAGVLMFAAASNSGAHSVIPAFPARLSNVFCIFAGDGMGNSGPTNPTPRRNRYNFMTLGEAVESAWPRSLSQNPWKLRKSGTSFATPIAVGIAAFLLLYAQQILSPADARRFKQYEKMEDLLFHMSNERLGYNVLSLTSFFTRPPEERRMLLMNLLEGKPWKA